ncbi:hypothetical protein [Nonomuraea sp. NPDC005501]|uniref:hypothetical protein n=1 Tax=Nonomuraea sp. NPDC005501 TaxID=3156884 RepID=UPI0033B43A55
MKLQAVQDALRAIRREHAALTYLAVARRAGVSRSFLYQNPDAQALMIAALGPAPTRRPATAAPDPHADATWRERALNSEEALKAAYAEVNTQRERIAIMLGQIRDLQAEYTEDTVQRVATENSTLKRRIRDLTSENRSLAEKLQTARSNNRFLDKRIADLEAQLLHPIHP